VSTPTGVFSEAVEHRRKILKSPSAMNAMKALGVIVRISPGATNAARIKREQAVQIGKVLAKSTLKNAMNRLHHVWLFPLTTPPLREVAKNRTSAVLPQMWPVVDYAKEVSATKDHFRRSASGVISVGECRTARRSPGDKRLCLVRLEQMSRRIKNWPAWSTLTSTVKKL